MCVWITCMWFIIKTFPFCMSFPKCGSFFSKFNVHFKFLSLSSSPTGDWKTMFFARATALKRRKKIRRVCIVLPLIFFFVQLNRLKNEKKMNRKLRREKTKPNRRHSFAHFSVLRIVIIPKRNNNSGLCFNVSKCALRAGSHSSDGVSGTIFCFPYGTDTHTAMTPTQSALLRLQFEIINYGIVVEICIYLLEGISSFNFSFPGV